MPNGFSGQTFRSTDGTVFNVVEGRGRARIGELEFAFEPHDVFVVPPWTYYHFETERECVLFSYSDRAAQEALGFWREEDPPNAPGRAKPRFDLIGKIAPLSPCGTKLPIWNVRFHGEYRG